MILKCSAEPKRRDVAQITIFAAEPESIWLRNKMYPQGQESGLRHIETAFEGETGALEGCSSLSTPAPPNKVDSFDTRVSETINLILFAKMLAAQGFSAKRHFGIVSLWALCSCFSPP